MTRFQERQDGLRVADGHREPAIADQAALLEEMRRSVTAMAQEAPVRLRRVRLSLGEATVEVEWDSAPPAPGPAPAPSLAPVAGPVVPAAPVAEPAATDGLLPGEHAVTAPLVGTFYVAPEPGAPPFVKVGDTVAAGDQLGIVEAMKLMNPVEADRGGRVVRILVADGEPVEYDQQLFVLAVADEE